MAAFDGIEFLHEQDPRQAIEAAIQACERRLGVSLTIHDLHGICRDAAGQALLMRRNEHRHPLCRLERASTARRCSEHCVEQVHAEAARRRRPFATWCWKGIRELVIPLLRDGQLVVVLYAGAWRRPRAAPRLEGVPRPARIRQLQAQLPVFDPVAARELASQLALWGQGLLDWIEHSRAAGAPAQDRPARIRRFLERHGHQPLRLEDLAAELEVSPSRCSHVVRDCFGCSFRELLLRERLDRARVLLATSQRSLGAIAAACGFGNEYYFNRVFAQRVGSPPGRWRAQQRQRWTG